MQGWRYRTSNPGLQSSLLCERLHRNPSGSGRMKLPDGSGTAATGDTLTEDSQPVRDARPAACRRHLTLLATAPDCTNS